MRRYYSVPVVFFMLAAALGLFLRWQFVAPTPAIRYTWFMHSHSHVMFLGWVFNVLYIAFTDHHVSRTQHSGFSKLFVLLQTFVVAMMISFPLQGYGTWSIIFSSLHTFGALLFIAMFFRRTNGERKTASLWFARASLIFFFLSTAGPFSLGYIMANGLGQTVWYNFSIYYYLHFQYNGFFLFGAFSLFFQLLETKQVPFDMSRARSFGKSMAIACVPAYALSILFAKPPVVFNITGAAAGILQIIALYILSGLLRPIVRQLKHSILPISFNLLRIVLLGFAVKLILQVASALPYVAQLAYELRPVVIAYLHLVLVGVISLFLFAWYVEKGLVKIYAARSSVITLLAGFIGSEICLVLAPWQSSIVLGRVTSPTVVFGFSVLMFVGAVLLCAAFKWGASSTARPAPL